MFEILEHLPYMFHCTLVKLLSSQYQQEANYMTKHAPGHEIIIITVILLNCIQGENYVNKHLNCEENIM